MTQIAINDEVNFRNVANATLKLARIPGHGCYNRQGRKSISSQEQVQHQNAKSTKYKDQQLTYCSQREQQCDQRPLYRGFCSVLAFRLCVDVQYLSHSLRSSRGPFCRCCPLLPVAAAFLRTARPQPFDGNSEGVRYRPFALSPPSRVLLGEAKRQRDHRFLGGRHTPVLPGSSDSYRR